MKYNFLVIGSSFTSSWVVDYLTRKNIKFKQYMDDSEFPLETIDQYSHIIVPNTIGAMPVIIIAKQKLIPIMSFIDLLYFFNSNSIFIGVTGSCGKSTFTKQLHHIFTKYTEKKVHLCGNIRIDPFQDNMDVYIIETSSIMLDKSYFIIFDYFVVLNIFNTHNERYDFFAQYLSSKIRPILQKQCKKHFLNYPTKYNNNELLEIVTDALNIKYPSLKDALDGFKQYNSVTNEMVINDDLILINDSSGTNLYSLEYALNHMTYDYLICGGSFLNSHKENFNIKNKPFILLTVGSGGKQIYHMLMHTNNYMLITKRIHFELLKDALFFISNKKGKVLFCPGTQSFGEFKDTYERNEFILNYFN